MIHLEEIYTHLNRMSPCSLSLGGLVIRDLLVKRIKDEEYNSAHQVIERFKKHAAMSTVTLERAECWGECGLAYFQMGNPYQAREGLKEALNQAPAGSHAHAILRWMLGEVHWHLADDHDEAIGHWEGTIRELDDLAIQADHEHRLDARDWYRKQSKDLGAELKDRIERSLSRL